MLDIKDGEDLAGELRSELTMVRYKKCDVSKYNEFKGECACILDTKGEGQVGGFF